MNNFRKEVCVESFSEALYAWELQADRLELCSHLDKDGLTPPIEMVRIVVNAIDIPVKVMIRPREGNFVYSKAEIDEMCASIEKFKELKVAGFVLGVLKKDDTINETALKKLLKATGDIPVTFHKAIDKTYDILQSVETLKKYSQVKYILTSGGEATADAGLEMLKKMHDAADYVLEIIPAGNITDRNVNRLHAKLQQPYYHGRKLVGKLL